MALIDSLVAYWTLDDADTNGGMKDVHDDHDGTINGADTGTAGKIGECYTFVLGSADDVVVADHNDFDTASWSVSFWMKMNAQVTSYQTLWNRDASGDHTYDVQTLIAPSNHGSHPNAIYFNCQSPDEILYSGALNAGTWYHIVCIFDSSNDEMRLWVDGSEVDSNIGSAHDWTGSINNITFGASYDGSSSPFGGELDEIGIWGKALSDPEVGELYNSGDGLAYPFTVLTNTKINIGDVWKDVDSIQINISDTWKDVAEIKQNIGDVWKTVF